MKPTTLKLIPLVAALAALSACHQGGVWVDAGASQKTSTSAESGLKSDRSINSSTSAAASIQMPASALALQAFSTYGKRTMLPPTAASAPEQRQLTDMIWSGIQTGPTKVDDLKTAQTFGAVAIASLSHPWQGWPFSCFGCSKESVWARGMAQQVVFANTVLTQVLSSLPPGTLADPSAAQTAIIAAYKKIPPAQLIAAYQQAGQQVQGSINFDFTGSGPSPVHFMIGSNDFQAGPTGWKWSMAGTPWLGEGRISGKDMQLSLASAIDKSSSQTSTTGTTTGTTTDQSAGGAAGVK